MKKERDKHLTYYKDSNFLRYSQYYFERDILRVATRMFMVEMELKKSGTVSRTTIPLSTQTYRRININHFTKILKELFLLILLVEVEIDILEIDDQKGRIFKKVIHDRSDAVVLFSGGLDSYAGIMVAESNFNNVLGVFVAHNDQARIIKIVDRIKSKIDAPIKTIYAPPMGSSGYSQLRGFLYILSGSIFMNLSKTDKLIISECGPTMYQTLFSPFDTITYTTHPYVLTAAKECLNMLFGRKLQIIIPFENLTKAEIVANSDIDDFRYTHSCISQRFGNHDGTCFGCVLRRLACIVNGVKDVAYKADMLKLTSNQDNLLNLLEFSDNLLKNYEEMPFYQIEKIEEFDKKNLFQRFALDNLAGLMLFLERNHPLYEKYIKSNEKRLEKRLEELWGKELGPNFNNFV